MCKITYVEGMQPELNYVAAKDLVLLLMIFRPPTGSAHSLMVALISNSSNYMHFVFSEEDNLWWHRRTRNHSRGKKSPKLVILFGKRFQHYNWFISGSISVNTEMFGVRSWVRYFRAFLAGFVTFVQRLCRLATVHGIVCQSRNPGRWWNAHLRRM